jgi:transposase-like protein
MISTDFKSVRELLKAFPDEQTCIDHLEKLRWNGNVVSPFDSTSKVYKCAGNKYKCKNTGKYFNVRTATLFDNTKIELQTWFLAIYLITGHKKGISSLQLSRDLNITQKSAWFLLHRIRACYGLDTTENGGGKLGGEGVVVEVDETISGGKVKNMHTKKRKAIKESTASWYDNKITVMGYAERGGKLRMQVLKPGQMIKDAVKENVDTTSILSTDNATPYQSVGKEYAVHGVVDHRVNEYVKDGVFHTNTLEGAFSLFDRMVIGTYHYVSHKHMQAYLNEYTFRYNTRKVNECYRFNLMLSNTATRLTYKNLIAK